ncbi:hypothetical protein EJB05_25892, partial [Eragrostis curvula]
MAKINVDAAISKNSGTAAAAAIARNEAGVFLGASVLVVSGMPNVETMEAVASREGLALAADLVLRKFRLASDCLSVVKAIHGAGLEHYGHIVKEIKARSTAFEYSEFVHESRLSNTDAHLIARGSVNLDIGRHVWFLGPQRVFVIPLRRLGAEASVAICLVVASRGSFRRYSTAAWRTIEQPLPGKVRWMH